MNYSAEVEQALRELARDAQERAAQAAQEAEQFAAALRAYLAKFSRPSVPQEPALDTALAESLQGATFRGMVRAWAEFHDGRLVVRDLVAAAYRTGRFESRTKAHRTMWSAVSQAAKKGELERVDEGVYQQIERTPMLITDGPGRELERLLGPADPVNRPVAATDNHTTSAP